MLFEMSGWVRAILQLVACGLLLFLTGCEGGKPPTRVDATNAYIIWVDLTEGSAISNGEVTSASPMLAAEAAMLIRDIHAKERGVKVLLRGITNNSASEDFVYDYTFNDIDGSTALNDANLTEIPLKVKEWIKTYQEKKLQGFDLGGAMDKTAKLSEGYPDKMKVGVIVISGLRNKFSSNVTPVPFARKTRVFCVAINEQGDSTRRLFEQRVKQAKGTIIKYQTNDDLYSALKAFHIE